MSTSAPTRLPVRRARGPPLTTHFHYRRYCHSIRLTATPSPFPPLLPADGQAEEDETVESTSRKVVDIIDAFRYQETSYDKKTFMAYIKDFMKARSTKQHAQNSHL